MGVPLLDLVKQYNDIRDDIQQVIAALCESQRFVLGEPVERLEREIADYCGVRFAIGVSSGTDALLCSLMAVGVGAGDEVITTPYTFFATAGAIARLGATPVFVDIDPQTYTIDPSLIESAITPKTKAVIPVHLFGQCADMDPLLSLAKKHSLIVIEDAAQAIGAEYKGHRAAAMAHLGCLSFYPTKNLGGFGDAGMITTNDSALAETMRMLRVHGDAARYDHKLIGGNFRLDGLQAAVLSVKLKHLDKWHERRRRLAARYDELFTGSNVICPTIADGNVSVFNLYCIQVPNRDKVQDHLRSRDIGCAVYYPLPLHLQPCFAHLGYQRGDFPRSEHLADHVLAVPMYPELTDEQVEQVAQAVLEACQKKN